MRARFALSLVTKIFEDLKGLESAPNAADVASLNAVLVALLMWIGIGVPLFLVYRKRQRSSTRRKGYD